MTDKVLLIGGAGYIGSVLAPQLVRAGYDLTIYDKFLYGTASLDYLSYATIVEGDTRHLNILLPYIKNTDYVIHLGELVGDALCDKFPDATVSTNYLATAAIARYCAYYNVKRFLYASSCSVYGSSTGAVLEEGGKAEALSLYGAAKLLSEDVMATISNLRYSIFRLGTVFGKSPRQRFDLVVNTLTAKAVCEGGIQIFGGNQWRPNTHVSDVARAFILALQAPNYIDGQIFNIVGENLQIKQLGELIIELIPGTEMIERHLIVDERSYRVSGEKAEKFLGFVPHISVRGGILEIANMLREGKIKDYKDSMFYNIEAVTNLC